MPVQDLLAYNFLQPLSYTNLKSTADLSQRIANLRLQRCFVSSQVSAEVAEWSAESRCYRYFT